MKKLFLSVALPILGISAFAQGKFEDVEKKANKGDYQAQRNLAYGYSAFPYEGQQLNPLLGCAWYLVILNSGSEKIHQGDIGNAKVYCGKLSPVEQKTATQQARTIYKRVYKQNPDF